MRFNQFLFIFTIIISYFISICLSQNPDCTLIVPPLPLTATGLSTPYFLTSTKLDSGNCNQTSPIQSAFVQGTIIDLVRKKKKI
jgi:hypothetical protein